MNSQPEETHRVKVCAQGHKTSILFSGMSLSQPLHVFINPQAP